MPCTVNVNDINTKNKNTCAIKQFAGCHHIYQDSCGIGQQSNYEGKLGNLLSNRSISHEIYLPLEPERSSVSIV